MSPSLNRPSGIWNLSKLCRRWMLCQNQARSAGITKLHAQSLAVTQAELQGRMDTSAADPFSQYARAVGQDDPFAIGPNLLAMPPPGLTLRVSGAGSLTILVSHILVVLIGYASFHAVEDHPFAVKHHT